MPQPELTSVLPPDAHPAYTLTRRAGAAAPPDGGERRAGLTRAELAQVIAERRFSLAFQPIVDLSDRRAAYHEAFLRPRPDGLPPLGARLCVELAADWGLGPALDLAVLDVALRAGRDAGGAPVSVNIGAAALADAAFLRAALARIGGAGAALLVELPALADLPRHPGLPAAIAALRQAGVRVCLDGVGDDAAALDGARLARFDQLKLSGAAVRAANAGARGRRLLTALVALARALGASVVAKQIETLPQAWLMAELGVRFGQGWLFGAPGPLPAGPLPAGPLLADPSPRADPG